MKKFLFTLIALLIFACESTSVKEADLHYLNGYWEISEVVFPDGSIKEYGVNHSIDFIQFEDGKGYRKKMQPKFDGSYDTSNDVESFTITPGNQNFVLQYKNEFSEWEENLVAVDSMGFSVTNMDGIQYTYKRFEPIKIPK
mgnify:FL=1